MRKPCACDLFAQEMYDAGQQNTFVPRAEQSQLCRSQITCHENHMRSSSRRGCSYFAVRMTYYSQIRSNHSQSEQLEQEVI
jgi:hypothetical protein